jgi:hypothetical protein
MEKLVPEYVLTHNGEVIFKGTENNCYLKLQRSQSQSATWAMKYEGWDVQPTGKQIENSIVELPIIKLYGYSPVVFYKGKLMIVDRRAMYGHCDGNIGEIVKANSDYFHTYPTESPVPGTYINPFYAGINNKDPDSKPYYTASENPTLYKGFEIHERPERHGIVWDVVKDSIIITMRAGLNGAKQFIDTETITP